MLEAICGFVSLLSWAVGIYYYPMCIIDVADCCDQTFMQMDNVIIDEAVAEYADNSGDECQALITAETIAVGDSPKVCKYKGPMLVAKLIKCE